MRAVVFLLLLVPWAAAVADSLAVAQQFYQSGLPRLALARVVRDQPQRAADPRWLEWESLRLSLLSQTGQSEELLRRVAALPPGLPADFVQKAYGHAAWAHLEQGRGEAARAFLAKLLWRFPLSSADQQWARRLVIRSWLADRRPDEAYRAMLRYQQDYAPLGREVATEFVQGLLAQGRATEALTWLGNLDPAGPTAAALSLNAGLLTPEGALERAQAALAAQPAALDWLQVLVEAADRAGKPLMLVEALEQRLAAGGDDAAPRLWQAYLALGEAKGNRAQLLQGDDASWLALAAGIASTAAVEARAVWAYLSQTAAAPQTRETARVELVAALLAAGRSEAAVRLIEANPWGGPRPRAEEGARLAEQAAGLLPEGTRRQAWLAAARYAERQGRLDLAADYAVQAVLASDMKAPDLGATLALKSALEYLEQAGLRDEARALHRRTVALRSPATKRPEKVVPAAAARSGPSRRNR